MLEKELAQKTEPTIMRNMQGREETIIGKTMYMKITDAAFKKLNQVQAKFISSVVDLGFDPENNDLQKIYQMNEKEYLNTASDYDIAVLSFRKKVSSYVFDRTQGIEPETVFDFVAREIKRYYGVAEDKVSFDGCFRKVFATFASNFSFTAQDILTYAKDPSPIKHPKPKIISQMTDSVNPLPAQTTAPMDVPTPVPAAA